MFCGANNIPLNIMDISHIQYDYGEHFVECVSPIERC